jgi:hypothetical protein
VWRRVSSCYFESVFPAVNLNHFAGQRSSLDEYGPEAGVMHMVLLLYLLTCGSFSMPSVRARRKKEVQG